MKFSKASTPSLFRWLLYLFCARLKLLIIVSSKNSWNKRYRNYFTKIYLFCSSLDETSEFRTSYDFILRCYQIGECKGLQETVASLKQQLSEALEFRNLSPVVTSRTGSKNLHEELGTEKDNVMLNDKNEVFLLLKQVFLLLWLLSICLVGKFEFRIPTEVPPMNFMSLLCLHLFIF